MDGLGQALTSAVAAYNQAVGSLESRVLVSARRLNQLGVIDAELDQPRLVEESARSLSAPELDTSGGPQLVAGPSAGPAPFGLADPCLADADDNGERRPGEGNRSAAGHGYASRSTGGWRGELSSAGRPGGLAAGTGRMQEEGTGRMAMRTQHPPAGSDQAREHIRPGEARTGLRRATDGSHDPAGSRTAGGSQAAAAAGARAAAPPAPQSPTRRITARCG